MDSILGTYTGTIDLFWVCVILIVMMLIGLWVGWVAGEADGREKERERWNKVGKIGIANPHQMGADQAVGGYKPSGKVDSEPKGLE